MLSGRCLQALNVKKTLQRKLIQYFEDVFSVRNKLLRRGKGRRMSQTTLTSLNYFTLEN